MSRRIAVILLSVATCIACSDENNRSQNQITTFDPDQGGQNNANNQGMDAGNNTTPTDMTSTDMGSADAGDAFDFAVAGEGVMHGTWLAARVNGADIATLQIRHEVGETALSGTFRMTEPAATGRLGGTTWINDTFTTSWTVLIDGLDERFALTMCTSDGNADELGCRFADPISGDVVDATLTRQ